MSKAKSFYIQTMEPLPNGLIRFWFKGEDGKTMKYMDAGECPNAQYIVMDDATFIEVYFESVFGIQEEE